MSDRLCLEGDRMVTCPVWGLEQRLITAERVRQQRDNAMAQVERLTRQRDALKAAVRLVNQWLDAEEYQHCSTQVRAGTAERLEAALLDATNRGNDLGFRLATAEARVADLEQALADMKDRRWAATRRYRDAETEIERLRGMIGYALDGPDADLPEALGGRAVESVEKVLRDALSGEGE